MSDAETNIFLFVPNIIGFARIVLGISSFLFMSSNGAISAFLYVASAVLDAFDGLTARALNQSSKFGAILDQLTDRCVFLGLLMHLAVFYSKWKLFFIFVAIVDIASHWMYLHACLLCGLRTHKQQSSNIVLNAYYTNKTVLFGLCAANELHFLALYLLHSISSFQQFLYILTILTAPLMLLKSGITVVHLLKASLMISELDLIERLNN